MKRILLILGMFLMGIPTLRAQSETQTKKVAILEVVDRDGVLNYGVKLLLRSTLAKAITQTPGYEGYDRVDMGAILGEQDFQRTGMVSDDQIKRLGEMTGAAYVLVAEAAKIDESTMIVTAKIINVETAKLERTDYEQMGFESKEMGTACQQMAGRLLGVSSSNAGVNDSNKRKAEANGSQKKDTATVYIPSGKIVFKGGKLQEMDNYGFHKKIGKTNTALYLGNLHREYKKAIAMRRGGISCMAIGGGFVVAGTSMILCNLLGNNGPECFSENSNWLVQKWTTGSNGLRSVFYYRWGYSRETFFVGGIITASVGVAVLIAGAPMYAVSNKKIQRILSIAEEQHATPPYKTACTFDFNTRHGLGFNLSF